MSNNFENGRIGNMFPCEHMSYLKYHDGLFENIVCLYHNGIYTAEEALALAHEGVSTQSRHPGILVIPERQWRTLFLNEQEPEKEDKDQLKVVFQYREQKSADGFSVVCYSLAEPVEGIPANTVVRALGCDLPQEPGVTFLLEGARESLNVDEDQYSSLDFLVSDWQELTEEGTQHG